jgi:hypothetical protein
MTGHGESTHITGVRCEVRPRMGGLVRSPDKRLAVELAQHALPTIAFADEVRIEFGITAEEVTARLLVNAVKARFDLDNIREKSQAEAIDECLLTIAGGGCALHPLEMPTTIIETDLSL